VSGAIIVIAFAVTAITYGRIWFGVDLTDESFYVVGPYRLVLGARPFVDETNVTQQTTAILLYPFVRGYDAVVGMTGLVLFVRHLQFLLSLLVAVAVYRSLRLFLDVRRAVPIAVAAIVFVPFTIHSVSYDSLGSALLTAGCFLGVRPLVDPAARPARLSSAVCLALAAFAYPPLVIAVAVCVAVRVALARGHRLREAAEHGLVALGLSVIGLAALASTAGFSKVVDDYRRSSRFLGQAGGVAKLHEIADQTRRALPHWYLLLAALVLLLFFWRYARPFGVVVLVALPFLVLPQHLTRFNTSLDFVAHLSWIAPVLYVLVRRRPGARLLFLAVWVPSFVAGATTTYASANGAVNFGVGGFPAAIVATVFLVWAIEDAMPGGRLWALVLAPALIVLALLLWSDTVPVYRDSNLSALTARMQSGPYAGLATTPWKRHWITRLSRDLAAYKAPCTILFFDDFAAGYMLAEANPDTNAAWLASVTSALETPYQDELLRYYRRRDFPNLVVVMRRIPYSHHQGWTVLHRTREPLLVTLRSSYRLLRWRRPYAIYGRRLGICTGRGVT
jgi:hypothetical protein